MKNNEFLISKKKAIIFAIIIDLIVTAIISIGAYDVVNIVYGQKMQIERLNFIIILYPNLFGINLAMMTSHILLSMIYKKKK